MFIQNDGNFKNTKTSYVFPFNRKIVTNENSVVLNSFYESGVDKNIKLASEKFGDYKDDGATWSCTYKIKNNKIKSTNPEKVYEDDVYIPCDNFLQVKFFINDSFPKYFEDNSYPYLKERIYKDSLIKLEINKQLKIYK